MNRGDFQQLAEEHLRHAKALLDAGLYSGAYYMCGYVVECALKACICRKTNQFDFYPKPTVSRDAWSHEFEKLIALADLGPKIDQERRNDNRLEVNWRTVGDWEPKSRYDQHPKQEAEDLMPPSPIRRTECSHV
jgi:hypothetical protein